MRHSQSPQFLRSYHLEDRFCRILDLRLLCRQGSVVWSTTVYHVLLFSRKIVFIRRHWIPTSGWTGRGVVLVESTPVSQIR